MAQNHIGGLDVQPLITESPAVSYDAELFPGMRKKWGLTWLINTEDVPGRRGAAVLRGRGCSAPIIGSIHSERWRAYC